MTADQARALTPGTLVRETEFNLEGVFEAVTASGREVEISHEYEGGGFDYWPLATLEVV